MAIFLNTLIAHVPPEGARMHREPAWEDFSKLIPKILDFGNKFVGSLCKLAERAIPESVSKFLKQVSERTCCIMTLNQIISGEITFSKINIIIDRILGGFSYTDEDLKIVNAALGLGELVSKECDASVQEKIFKALKVPFHMIPKLKNSIQELAKTEAGVAFAKISLIIKSLPALGVSGKLEKIQKSIEIIRDPQTYKGMVPKAVCDLAGGLLGVGSFALSFVSGAPSYISLGVTGLTAAAGFASFCLESAKSENQKSVEKAIKDDFAALKKHKSDMRSIYHSRHAVSRDFYTFEDRTKALLANIERSDSPEKLVSILEDYLTAREQLKMPNEVSEKAIHDLIGIFKVLSRPEIVS